MTVLFATGLFFAGVSGQLDDFRMGAAALALAVIVILGAIIVLLTFPVEL
jgi:hypothetical protein